jgi:alkanesulfonate monooxygenase SsuD/methylene tetrahydromethanopterin reductase-like flavin-dependent oxidoreductase (luciferase family)
MIAGLTQRLREAAARKGLVLLNDLEPGDRFEYEGETYTFDKKDSSPRALDRNNRPIIFSAGSLGKKLPRRKRVLQREKETTCPKKY